MKLRSLLLLTLLAVLSPMVWGQSAKELVDRWREDYREPAHLYEELTLITTAQRGAKSVVTLKAYALREGSGSRFLWTVVTPPAAKGMSVFAARGRDGAIVDGKQTGKVGDWLFGSVFTIADLIDLLPAGAALEMAGTRVLDRAPHYLLRVRLPGQPDGEFRRLYLRKSNLWLSRVEDVDSSGAVQRRLQFKDPQPDDLGVLRPQMALLDDARRGERSLLKVARRVHSADYVPEAVFIQGTQGTTR